MEKRELRLSSNNESANCETEETAIALLVLTTKESIVAAKLSTLLSSSANQSSSGGEAAVSTIVTKTVEIELDKVDLKQVAYQSMQRILF